MTRLILLFRRLVFLTAILSLVGLARADFTATYDFASVTATSGTTDPTAVPVVPNLTLGSFTAVGTPANPNASVRFSFTAWPVGAVNGNDTYSANTGVINTGEYYSVTLTPQPGFALNLTGLTFTIQRSSTGIRTYAVRSNAGGDAFATNLPASISPANGNLNVQADNVFFYAFDALATAQNGSTVTLTGPNFQNITTPVTFRFYGWNAEASGGTCSIDNVVFTGNVISAGGPTPPVVTTPPASQTVTEGATVQFTVAASGTAPLAYQWRKGVTNLADGGIITGTTTDTLTLTGVALGDAGNYNVVVTNSVNSATSADATLTVNPILVAPSITTQPSPQAVAPGGTASFSVVASGTAPLSYQWRKGGVPLVDGGVVSGATTATLTLTGITAADVDSYDVVVSNGVNPNATSNAVALTLLTAVITPTGQISYAGGAYTQDFNTLPASGTFTLPSNGPFALTAAPVSASGLGGWSFAKYDGTGTAVLFRVDAGTSTSGSTYSYGTVAAPDRALGALASGSTITRFGVALVNNTGQTVTQFTLSYTGEEWRRGSAAANVLAFDYGVGATDINNGTFTAAAALSFTAPNITGANAALDGNAAANRTAVTGTITGISWAPGQTLVLRWTDVNDGGNDDGLAIDDLTFNTLVGPGDVIPAVAFANPADGAVDVPVASPVSVTFNEPVNVTSSWFTLTGSTSGAHAATVNGGPSAYTLTPTTPFAEGEDVTLTVLAAQVTDQATGTRHPGADYSAGFFTFSSAPLPIHTVQGSGLTSPYVTHVETVSGVVVATFQAPGQTGGYYIEAPDADQDANPATSEGMHVFDNVNSVTVGDFVTVTGIVSEFGTAPSTETEIESVSSFTKNSTGNVLPTAASVTLPFPTAGYAERYEGMRITLTQSLTVTDNYDLGTFGELLLSNGRLSTPTNVVAPGAPAQALEAANLLNQIILDDDSSASDPDPTPYLNSSDPTIATRRTGSTTTGVAGVIVNKFGTYVVEPTATPTFVEANPRPVAPASTGSLRIAIGNVENFMNGDGLGGGFPTSRGASTYEEFQRQLPKVTSAILNLAPDIMGLTEIENDRVTNGDPDSYGPTSAIAQLVDSLNAGAPSGTTYAFINAAAVDITTDQIHVALIYRTQVVEPVGLPAMLDDPSFNNVARNPLAQTFRQLSTGGKLTVCINHLRAKGGAAAGAGNTDSGDGQGTNNALRVQEANALTTWLAADPTGSGDPDFLIIGDLNSYAKEDPIVAIENAGFTSLTERFEGEGGYSYSFNGEFGHLDHALATPSLNAQVLSAATWHVNSDEPTYYDYNVEFKSAAQQAINAGTPYRYSDHDPVVIGVELTAPPVITAQPVSQTVSVGTSVSFSVTATGVPAPTYQWRKGGNPISGANSATYTIASAVTANAGSYDVVVTNSSGMATSDPATLTVNQAVASVSLSNLSGGYNGAPHPVTVTTVPGGLNVVITYDGSLTAPTNAGSYAVAASVVDPDYTGSASGTLVISKAVASVTLGGLSQTYDGTPKSATATTMPGGLSVSFTYNGSVTAPTDSGSYAVVATVIDANYVGGTTGTLVIHPGSATISLQDLLQPYDGAPKPVTVTTNPASLPVTITYNGGSTPPTLPGSYAVVATLNDPNHTGSASGTLVITISALVRHAPTLNAGLDGSLQLLLPESTTLNGSAWISGDLLVPGTPSVKLNGQPTFGGTIDNSGAAAPTAYTITLNGNAVLRHVVRRVNALAMPVVATPPAPAGTRSVSLNSAGQSPGSFATLRDLTLNGNYGQLAVPAGTYGSFTANGSSSFVFGVAGSSTPVVYNLQNLTLNGTSRLVIVGPVILNLANGAAISGSIGASGHPEWLQLNIASGGLTLNSNVTFDGYVTAPNGTITINGNTTLNGGVICDRLTLNGTGVLNDPEL